MTDLVERLRTWAEDDVRAIARDMQIMNLSVDTGDVRRWGDLMDEAANEIERLRSDVQKYKDKEAAIARMWHDPASQ